MAAPTFFSSDIFLSTKNKHDELYTPRSLIQRGQEVFVRQKDRESKTEQPVSEDADFRGRIPPLQELHMITYEEEHVGELRVQRDW